jgi:hypothetical protein
MYEALPDQSTTTKGDGSTVYMYLHVRRTTVRVVNHIPGPPVKALLRGVPKAGWR